MIVNGNREKLFLFDEPLVTMWQCQDEFIVIKTRDRHPKRAINYHAGDIWGCIQRVGSERDAEDNIVEIYEIALFFGETERSMQYDPETKLPNNCVSKQVYLFQKKTLQAMVTAIELMTDKRGRFESMLRAAETRPAGLHLPLPDHWSGVNHSKIPTRPALPALSRDNKETVEKKNNNLPLKRKPTNVEKKGK